MAVIACPECGGEVEVGADAIVGEIIACPECGVELEVTGLNPLTVALAAEVEEDWGE
jgi:alpha-aminoadipate/glutamate carrier protein LysW